ncbi:MAG TPA: hypothetical protein VKA89_04590 [Solirubrobacterales bacterium]|nr:hypothetical protein [Solirubrobacterales bacterium]
MAGLALEAGEPAGLTEAARLSWRERADAHALRRDGRRWTLWTTGIAATFGAPSVVLVALEPLMLPVALLWSAHGWAVCRMQAGRGARAALPLGSATGGRAERVALGLLGDLLDHRPRMLAARTGLVLEEGRMGQWLIGQRGALLVRPGGRRVDSFCVRVAEEDGLPEGDRAAHLLLALREDEEGFLTVANMNFSGAGWRLRRRMRARERPALDEARAAAQAAGASRPSGR